MKLIGLTYPTVICEEDEALRYEFDYLDKKGKPSRPVILYLGTWNRKLKSGETKQYICGINLNYLTNPKHRAQLKAELPEILDAGNLKARYDMGATLLPHIFKGTKYAPGMDDLEGLGKHGAYRTYRADNVSQIIKGRLLELKVEPQDVLKAKKLAAEDGLEWEEIEDDDIRQQYVEQAIRSRGEDTERRQERAQKDKEKLEPPEDELEDEPQPIDDLEPPEDEIAPKPVSSRTPPGPRKTRRKFVRPEPGPGIEPEQKPKKQLSPLEQGVSGVVMPDPNRVRVDEPAPPAEPHNPVDIETQNEYEQGEEKTD